MAGSMPFGPAMPGANGTIKVTGRLGAERRNQAQKHGGTHGKAEFPAV